MQNIVGQYVIINENQVRGRVVEELFHGSILVIETDDGTRFTKTMYEVTPQTFLTESQ